VNTGRINAVFNKMSEILNTELNLMEPSGYIIKSTESEKIGEYDIQLSSITNKKGIIEKGDYLYYFNDDIHSTNLIVSIKGENKDNKKLAEIIGFFLTQDFEDISREEFIKNILLNEIDENEINSLCERFEIDFNKKFQVIVIEIKEKLSSEVQNLIGQIYPNELFIKMSKSTFAFIKKFHNNCEKHEINIYDAIYSELLYEPKIGIGTVVNNLRELNSSFQKASKAIEYGKLFLNDRKIYYYKDLGLPVLIKNMHFESLHQLNKDMNYNIEEVVCDSELVMTALRFFENNLNISETSKKLFIHRNTLIYRLNKILKISGYDLRNFEDAINFKIAMFINNYLRSEE
jgi:carbohydrate diacid regulator